MRAKGLGAVPVFYCGERYEWLSCYLDAGVNCIGLGGHAKSRQQTAAFYKTCFTMIANCGRHVHVHAFGLSNRWLLGNFYFPSVDATTWLFHSQRFAVTYIGDLRHLISTEAEAIAARTYKEAW